MKQQVFSDFSVEIYTLLAYFLTPEICYWKFFLLLQVEL